MKTVALFIVISFFAFSMSEAQTMLTARGTVFHDLDNNGLFGTNEPGLAGVAVSNGVDVVLTDDEGGYTLPVSDDNIIFVINPAGFNYPLNEFNLPQYYYIHKPGGSPELKYAGVAPTGPLPEEINFPLLAGDASEKFSMVVISDPQTYSIEQIDYYDRDIVEDIKGTGNPLFGITLGDIVGDVLDYFGPINKATSRAGIPWFHVFGNHDMNFDAQTWQHADETFERVYGPANYAFNQGKVHFIVLNDVIYPNDLTESRYVGGFRESQFTFIENTLQFVPTDHLVVLCVHIPLFDEELWGDTFIDEHRQRLFDLLKDYPHTLSMSGHTHFQMHYFFDEDEGWKGKNPHHHYNVGTASGDWWSGGPNEKGIPDATMRDGTPNGYNILHFDGNTYTYDYKVAGQPMDYKMKIYGPALVPRNRHFRAELYVNFFQGHKMDTVEFRVNEGEWKKMRYVEEQDPHMSAIRYEWDFATELPQGLRPSNPFTSRHLWKTRMPTNVPAGENTIYVRVKDSFGRIFTDEFQFVAVDQE